MLKVDGIPETKDLEDILPSQKRRKAKPYVVIECFQRIPCDPCSASCPFGAILPFKDINDLPKIDYSKCTGCGICISICPGLAIFVIDETNSDYDLVSLPYEFLPLPQKDEEVWGLDRKGEAVCKAIVEKVIAGKRKTRIVRLRVPKGYAHKVRFLRKNKDAEWGVES